MKYFSSNQPAVIYSIAMFYVKNLEALLNALGKRINCTNDWATDEGWACTTPVPIHTHFSTDAP